MVLESFCFVNLQTDVVGLLVQGVLVGLLDVFVHRYLVLGEVGPFNYEQVAVGSVVKGVFGNFIEVKGTCTSAPIARVKGTCMLWT